ncbi:MAG: hypothetical protein KAH24_07425, partial [Holophagae bacterium]|nr:hypothetical protein [Holophagae bacterium]
CDLLPAREEKLETRNEQLTGTDYHIVSQQIDLAVRRAQELFVEIQTQEAVVGYKALGVDAETARAQIALRPDFKLLAKPVAYLFGGFGDYSGNSVALLYCFESFEAGFHPETPGGLKFKEKWCSKKK